MAGPDFMVYDLRAIVQKSLIVFFTLPFESTEKLPKQRKQKKKALKEKDHAKKNISLTETVKRQYPSKTKHWIDWVSD